MQVIPHNNQRNKLSKRFIIIGITVILIIIGFIYTTYVPDLIKIDKYRDQILHEATIKFKKYNIYLSKVTLDLPITGGALLKAKSLIISRKNDDPVLSGENIQVKIALLPLINKEIVIKDFNIDNLKLTLIRKTSGKMDIEDILKLPKPKLKYNVKLDGTRGSINNYEIVVIDNYVSPNQKHIFQGKTFKLIKLTENKILSFQTEGIKNLNTPYKFNGLLRLNPKKEFFENTFSLEGNISDLNIPEIAPYTKHKFSIGKIDTEFKLNLSNGLLKFENKNTIKSTVVVPDINLKLKKGSITLNGELDKNNLDILNLSSSINDINGDVNGNINSWSGKNSKLNLKISTNEFNIDNLNGTIPSIRSNYDLISYVNNYKIKGITKVSLNVVGNKDKPTLFGEITLNNGIISLPNNTNIMNISSLFIFNGNLITIKDSIIPLTSKEYIKIAGSYNPNTNKLSQLKVTSTKINLKNLKNPLIGVFKLYNIPIYNINDATFNGISKIDLVFNNNIFKPDIDGNIFVDIKNLKSLDKGNILKSLTGTLLFKGNRLITKPLQITLYDNSKLLLEADYDIYSKMLKLAKINSNQINLQNLQKLILYSASNLNLATKDLQKYKINGNGSIDLRLSGPINKLDSDGVIILKNAELYDNLSKMLIRSINGLIEFKNGMKLNNLSGVLENNKILLTGYKIPNKQGKFIIKIAGFKLNDIKNLAIKLKLISPSQLVYLKRVSLSGSISGDISFSESGNKFTPEAKLKVNPGKIIYPSNIGAFAIQKGLILVNNNSLDLKNLILTKDKSTFDMSAKVYNLASRNPGYDFELTGNKISFDLIKKFTQNKFVPNEFKNLIAKMEGSSGLSTINIKARNNDIQFIIRPQDFNLKTGVLTAPLDRINGEIKLANNNFDITDLIFNYGKSNIKLSGSIKNVKKLPMINITTHGYFSPLDFSEFFTEEFKNKIVFTEPINIFGSVKGNIKDWELVIDSFIPESAEVSYKDIFKKPPNTPAKFLVASKRSSKGIAIQNMELTLGESKINASGNASFSAADLIKLENLRITTPLIDLNQFNDFVSPTLIKEKFAGKIQSEINLDGELSSPDITGNISFYDVSLPVISAKNTNGKILFNGKDGDIKDFHTDINGMLFDINSHISSFKGFPIELSNLSVKSPSVRLTELIAIALQFGNMPPPITIKNGTLDLKEAIIDKLITTDFTGNIMLCSNGVIQINNMKLNTAGGTAKGNIYSNIMENKIGAQLKVVGVKANAVATILLDLPNEVFGDLNSMIVFDSKGNAYNDILSNAEGKASLIINNGRFTKLGTLEHLLTASNIIQGGIKGFNLNNLLATIIPTNTGKFELLTGDFTVKEGILKTDNLVTRGKNLSLELNGNYNIANGNTDLIVKGHLSKNVSGLLGVLGKFNISTITDFIPGLGFIPGVAKKRGILDFIPGLGFIPGFGGISGSKQVRDFAVDIKGKLYEKSSVKNFRWTN